MSKTYTLLSSEPLNGFEEELLRMLRTLSEENLRPKAAVCIVLTEDGETVTDYYNASMQDMMVAKGYLEQDIQSDAILANLPFYVRQAREEGLLDEDYDEEDDDGDTP